MKLLPAASLKCGNGGCVGGGGLERTGLRLRNTCDEFIRSCSSQALQLGFGVFGAHSTVYFSYLSLLNDGKYIFCYRYIISVKSTAPCKVYRAPLRYHGNNRVLGGTRSDSQVLQRINPNRLCVIPQNVNRRHRRVIRGRCTWPDVYSTDQVTGSSVSREPL